MATAYIPCDVSNGFAGIWIRARFIPHLEREPRRREEGWVSFGVQCAGKPDVADDFKGVFIIDCKCDCEGAAVPILPFDPCLNIVRKCHGVLKAL